MPAFTCNKAELSNMRLTKHEILTIVTEVYNFIKPEAVELRLFGSRVNDKAKGGDIDLLLLTKNSSLKNSLLENKLSILIAIKNTLGEQRIDLKIASLDELNKDPFLRLIYPHSVLLHPNQFL